MRRSLLAVIILALLASAPSAARAQNVDSPYGINTHLPGPDVLDKTKAAGFDWVRVDFNWVMMEPQRGAYDWAITDQVVQDAAARGLNVFATLAYAPPWSNGGQHHAYPATDVNDWTAFVRTVVSRYKGTVKHWGMWNEPNLSHFFHGTIDDYVDRILAPGAAAAKAEDPTCFVLGPDLAHLKSAHWERWLREVLRKGVQHLDVITHHLYKRDPADFFANLDGRVWFWNGSNVKRVIERNGGRGKPVWLTETGWTSSSVGEQRQADHLVGLLDGLQSRPWIEKVFFYEIIDDGTIADRWGLLRPDLSEKPSFDAVRRFIATHPAGPSAPQPAPQPAPAPQPGQTWVFEAERDLAHGIGRADGDGWSASTSLDGSGHLTYGPYTHVIPGGPRVATFRLMVDVVNAADHVVARLDVFDATAGRVLAQRDVRRRQLAADSTYGDFDLTFTAEAGHQLELRTFWTDTSYVRQDRVTVR